MAKLRPGQFAQVTGGSGSSVADRMARLEQEKQRKAEARSKRRPSKSAVSEPVIVEPLPASATPSQRGDVSQARAPEVQDIFTFSNVHQTAQSVEEYISSMRLMLGREMIQQVYGSENGYILRTASGREILIPCYRD